MAVGGTAWEERLAQQGAATLMLPLRFRSALALHAEGRLRGTFVDDRPYLPLSLPPQPPSPSLPPIPPGARLLLPLHPHVDHCENRRLLIAIQPDELVREDAKLMEGVVSVIRFPVALLDQFFTSSTSSLMSRWKPLSSWTF